MKKYLFGLGAMIVGAGLMFVLMHGEVSGEELTGLTISDSPRVETSNFICNDLTLFSWDWKMQKYLSFHDKYLKLRNTPDIIKECVKEDKKEKTTCYMFVSLDNPAMSCVKG